MSVLAPSPKCGEDYEVLEGQALPEAYKRLSESDLDRRIGEAKAKLGRRVVILGHHYQRDEIIKFADYRGDSLKLAQQAASSAEAEYIVFCGVHFMAEAADILSRDDQTVILPNLEAGCSMADMAAIGQVETCWAELEEAGVADATLPLPTLTARRTSRRSWASGAARSAPLPTRRKWFGGPSSKKRNCFSSPISIWGGSPVSTWAFRWSKCWCGTRRNTGGGTARKRFAGRGSISGRALLGAWPFQAGADREGRREHPGIRVIVHPECTLDVVQAADEYGSTEYILKRVVESPHGTKWAVGTEINMVNRLAREMPDKTIFCLDPVVCPCATMYRIHPAYLCRVLENLLEGKAVNPIRVPESIKHWSKVALERMLSLK